MSVECKNKVEEGKVRQEQMVNNYEFINNLRKMNLLNEAIKRGLISVHFLDYETIYETFLKARKEYPKMESYRIASALCEMSETTIRMAVKKMISFD